MSTNPFRRSSLKGPSSSSPLNIPPADTHGSSPGPLSVDTKGKSIVDDTLPIGLQLIVDGLIQWLRHRKNM